MPGLLEPNMHTISPDTDALVLVCLRTAVSRSADGSGSYDLTILIGSIWRHRHCATAGQVARRMFMSERTLRRRFSAAGLNSPHACLVYLKTVAYAFEIWRGGSPKRAAEELGLSPRILNQNLTRYGFPSRRDLRLVPFLEILDVFCRTAANELVRQNVTCPEFT